jgi:hypothetical protein
MFDGKAHDRDPWSWLSMHRAAFGAGAVAAAAALIGRARQVR